MPRVGVVEIFAQQATVHYRQHSEWHSGTILVMPRVIPNQTSGAIFSACESGVPLLSSAKIVQMCSKLRFMLLSEFPDGCSAHSRKLAATANRLPKNCFFVAGACAVHSVHRMVVSALPEGRLLGDVYACKYISHLSGHYNRLYRCLHDLVFGELVMVARSNVPDAEFMLWQQHTGEVLQHTYLRQLDHTRGRLGHGALFEGSSKHARNDVYAARVFINGNICLPQCMLVLTEDVLQGRTQDEAADDLKEGYFAALMKLNVLLGAGVRLPSKGRWGSMTGSASEVALGQMVHGVYGRAFAKAFPDWKSGEELDDEQAAAADDDDYHTACKNKVDRVSCIVRSPVREMEILLMAFSAEPIDWLWQRLQHLDAASKPLFTLQRPELNPFHQTMSLYVEMLTRPFASTSLRALHRHFSQSHVAEPRCLLSARTRGIIGSILAQLYWRLVLPFAAWPFPLVTLVDAAASADECQRVLQRFFAAEACCLDAGFSRKARSFFQSAEQLLADVDFRDVLVQFATHFKWSNMATERLLALFKAATPSKRPVLERFCCSGLLAQVLQEHYAAGGIHPGIIRRKDVEKGTPLDSAHSARSVPTRARGHVALMAFRVREARAAKLGGRLTQAELRRVRRAGAEEFQKLPMAAQAEWSAHAVAHATVAAEASRAESESQREAMYGTKRRVLWGTSSFRAPLRRDVAERTIKAHRTKLNQGNNAARQSRARLTLSSIN